MRMMSALLVGAFVLITVSALGREWTDSSGTYKIEAELVECANGAARLKKPDGSMVSVPLDRLCTRDKEFIQRQLCQDSLEGQTTSLSLPQLIERVEPAVVRIDVNGGLGSGFVVDSAGIVVTNFHVVEGARSATVTFRDGNSAKVAGYLGVDVVKDIAILKVESSQKLSAIGLRDGLPQKGEQVATFGAPKGLNLSVSQGVVAAVRSDEEIEKWMESRGKLPKTASNAVWVQTTAPISSGNSGGPLVDFHGRVVGANTWVPNEEALELLTKPLPFGVSMVGTCKVMWCFHCCQHKVLCLRLASPMVSLPMVLDADQIPQQGGREPWPDHW